MISDADMLPHMPPERMSLILRAAHMVQYRRNLRVAYGDASELPPEPVDYSMLNRLNDSELINIINGTYA